jgi:hypothetical protein
MRKVTPRPLGHGALTNSRPSAGVTLLIRRVADLAAALLDSLFEHPEVVLALAPNGNFQPYFWYQPNFSAACYAKSYSEAGLRSWNGVADGATWNRGRE